jgi:predicted kinase
MQAKLQILVGMIASGKSTYCRNAARSGAIIVNDDSIVNAVHANDYTLYDKDLKVLYKSTENHLIAVAIGMGRTVVIDRGLNLSLTGRKRWLALAGSFDVPVEAVEFRIESPKIHASRRVRSDPRGHDFAYWTRVAESHLNDHERPTLEEGFAMIHQISIEEIDAGRVI